MSAATYLWVGDLGEYAIPIRFRHVRIRRDNWPDQRFKLGREMTAYFRRREAAKFLDIVMGRA